MNDELLQRAKALCAAANALPDFSTILKPAPVVVETEVVVVEQEEETDWKTLPGNITCFHGSNTIITSMDLRSIVRRGDRIRLNDVSYQIPATGGEYTAKNLPLSRDFEQETVFSIQGFVAARKKKRVKAKKAPCIKQPERVVETARVVVMDVKSAQERAKARVLKHKVVVEDHHQPVVVVDLSRDREKAEERIRLRLEREKKDRKEMENAKLREFEIRKAKYQNKVAELQLKTKARLKKSVQTRAKNVAAIESKQPSITSPRVLKQREKQMRLETKRRLRQREKQKRLATIQAEKQYEKPVRSFPNQNQNQNWTPSIQVETVVKDFTLPPIDEIQAPEVDDEIQTPEVDDEIQAPEIVLPPIIQELPDDERVEIDKKILVPIWKRKPISIPPVSAFHDKAKV